MIGQNENLLYTSTQKSVNDYGCDERNAETTTSGEKEYEGGWVSCVEVTSRRVLWFCVVFASLR